MSAATSNLQPVVWPDDVAPAWEGRRRVLPTEVLHEGVARFPDNAVLIFNDSLSIITREPWDETERLDGGLRGRVAMGERVALAIGNPTEFVIAYLAVVANRAVAVVVQPETGAQEAEYVFGDSEIKMAIVDEMAAPVFAALHDADDRLSTVFKVDDAADFCARQIARQKVLRYVEHWTRPFPRTETQRIPKSQLKVDGVHQTFSVWDRLAATERQRPMSARFEDLPNTVGQVIQGDPFQLNAEDSELFNKATWLDKAYPGGDVPEYPDQIVEGFLLLSMLDAVLRFATGKDNSAMWGLNYGLDKVRFIAPVHFGDTIIPTFETLEVVRKDEGFKVLRHCIFRLEGTAAPAMVADWWGYALPRGTVEKARREG